MPEEIEESPSFPTAPPSRARRRLGTFLFVLVLAMVIIFGYNVFHYYRQIQSGVIDPETYSFESTQANQSRLLAIAQAAPGSGELATTDDPSRGPVDAKLTIVEFADFGCPFSQQESYIVTALAKQYPNDVRVIYRDFPLTDLHPGADLAAEAGGCANEQGKFWEYHDLLFRNSGEFTQDVLVDYAGQLGRSMNKFSTCLESGKYTDEVKQDLTDGVAAGVTGTPTFFLNGEKIDGAVPFNTFKEIVDAFIAE